MRWILAFAMTGSLGFFSMASAEEAVKFKMHRIGTYRSEACGVADFNKDGKLDIIAGKFLGALRRCLPVWLLMAVHFAVFAPFGLIAWFVPVLAAFVAAGMMLFQTGTGLLFGALVKRTTTAVVLNVLFGLALWALVSLVLPEDTEVSTIESLYEGMREEFRQYGGIIVGGNISRSPERFMIDFFLLGRVAPDRMVLRSGAQPGDVVMVSGTMGDHGVAVMSVREGLEFEAAIESDTAPLWDLVEAMLAVGALAVQVDAALWCGGWWQETDGLHA